MRPRAYLMDAITDGSNAQVELCFFVAAIFCLFLARHGANDLQQMSFWRYIGGLERRLKALDVLPFHVERLALRRRAFLGLGCTILF